MGQQTDSRLPPSVVLACLAFLSLITPPRVHAQILAGDWVDRAEQRIRQHRMADVRIIVLDAEGKPAKGAKVELNQLRHDFLVAVAAPASGWEGRGMPGAFPASLNAAHRLEASTPHASEPGRQGVSDLDAITGPLLSADPARLPEQILSLPADAMPAALLDRVGMPDGGDLTILYGDLVGHDFIERRLGIPMVRRLFEHAHAAPRATLALHFQDALTTERIIRVRERLTAFEQAFVPFDAVVLTHRFDRDVQPIRLERTIRSAGLLNGNVYVLDIEAGGDTGFEAAKRLETALRLLFAEQSVKGIGFRGLFPEEVSLPNAALLDEKGELTANGRLVDGLFRKAWWSSESATADELGNVRARVFKGIYELRATLPGGQVMTKTVRITGESEHAGEKGQLIVFEPIKPELEVPKKVAPVQSDP